MLALILDGVLLFAIIYVLFIVLAGVLLLAFPQPTESTLMNLDSDALPAGPVEYVVLMLAWYGVLAGFSELTGNDTVDLVLGVVGLVVWIVIGITISNSPERQGFHNRLAGGTHVVRPE